MALKNLFLAAFLNLFSPSSYDSLGPTGILTVSNKDIAPDGFMRSAVVVNGVYPAPLITGIKGDTFRLNVVNSLTDPTMLRGTSIHWHGVLQNRTAWADGVAGVTQCPISPGQSFSYEFQDPNVAGTFWYHSHFKAQYCDGLRGPLVIYDHKHDPHKYLYDVDDETTVITVGEWYHDPSPSVKAPGYSTLINGKGRSVGGPSGVALAELNVVHGNRYRFRLISISCSPNYIFSIDGHQLTIIEADGQNVLPVTVDRIQIFAGQRYSFILTANEPVANYWIRALPNSGQNNLSTGYKDGTNSAILRYKGAPVVEPTTNETTHPVLLQETQLVPLSNPTAPGRPCRGGGDVNHNLKLTLNKTTERYFVNDITFEPPTVPVLLQILSGIPPQQLMPNGSIYTLKRNQVVEISIPMLADSKGPHPFHLHGHTFSVVRSAGANTSYNYLTPVRRDVVSIGDEQGSNVTFRFTTDNPGPWILHCHIDWHLEDGLAIVFAEEDDVPDVVGSNPPASWKELCPIYNSLPASATSVLTVSPVPSVTVSPMPSVTVSSVPV